MKLIEKYNRLNLSATILTFVAGSVAFYFLLSYILLHQVDETLQTEQQEITMYVNTHHTLPEIIKTKDQYTSFEKATRDGSTSYQTVKNRYDNNEEALREIQFYVVADGRHYLVKVDKPLEETEALLQVIIGVTVGMIALILLTGYLTNRIMIRRLWKPFYQTIEQVKAYHLPAHNSMELPATAIEEFSLMNHTINDMVVRIQQDYSSLKNFTGQAAHEMQTPLAIIRTRLDGLMQNEALLEKNAQQVVDIERSVQRLSKLHQSLLLLTKVEHRQFELNEKVRFDEIIKDKCSEYGEVTESMGLKIVDDLQPVSVIFHQHLAEILVNNLLGNAIRYNKKGGTVGVVLRHDALVFANSSEQGQLDENKLFEPFYRSDPSTEGNGLGLSIVKEICQLAGYSITYRYLDERQVFTITFA